MQATALAGCALTAPALLAAGPKGGKRSRDMLFDADWSFLRGDPAGAQALDFDDSHWRPVNLPHDWSIEDLPDSPRATSWEAPAAIWNDRVRPAPTPNQFLVLPRGPDAADHSTPRKVGPFDPDRSAGTWGTGWTVGGTGWYRKHFQYEQPADHQVVELRFDGVFHDAEVWLNGVLVGNHDHGYSPFRVDLTRQLRRGANVVAVRVQNEGFTGRWYTGSGIYRHVWLTRTEDVRVPAMGVFVSTPVVSRRAAHVRVAVEVENRSSTPRRIDIETIILGPDHRVTGAANTTAEIAAKSTTTVVLSTELGSPKLWSPDAAALHSAEIRLLDSGRTLDMVPVTFGIRQVAADSRRGLTINGQSVKLKGACLHHDHGLLGAASYDRAEIRKVEILKANGYNAIRCSHNLYAPALYDACDRLGMIVIDEMFDVWKEGKVGHDLGATRFKTKWRQDVRDMVRRDRNHPSVVFWSIGNEIPESSTPDGIATAAALKKAVLELDDTRLITAAVAPMKRGKALDAAHQYLDVAGINYQEFLYEEEHAANPSRVYVGTEQFARDIHDAWRKVERYPWLIGDFVWTGIDYLGEVGAGSSRLRRNGELPPKSPIPFSIFLWDYPFYQSGCGEIDLTGRKKPQSHYRDVLWDRSPLELFVRRPPPDGFHEELGDWAFPDELQSWTWPGARELAVRVYTVGDEVRLLLNGREVARKRLAAEDKLIAEVGVRYEPGTLVAVALRQGTEIARKVLETVGEPAHLDLRAEWTRARAEPGELGYFVAEVRDSKDRIVPDARCKLAFRVTGPARLLAAGSANPSGIESFTDPDCTSFHGAAQAIVRSSGRPGLVEVKVFSPGLTAATAAIRFT